MPCGSCESRLKPFRLQVDCNDDGDDEALAEGKRGQTGSAIEPHPPPLKAPRHKPGVAKLFPWSVDSKQRRSSFLSVHMRKGSLIGNVNSTMRNPCPLPLMTADSALRIRAELRTASRQSLVDQRSRARPHALPSWREDDTLVESGVQVDSLADEVAEDERWKQQDVRSHSPSAESPTGRRPPFSLSVDEYLSLTTGEALGVENSGKFGSPAYSGSLSGFSSISGSQETNDSRIEVHNFLEECDESGSEEDGIAEGREGDAGGIDGSDSKEGGIQKSMQMALLDVEDIAALMDNRELREALLEVEDLHFGGWKTTGAWTPSFRFWGRGKTGGGPIAPYSRLTLFRF